ncbi:unnamed protein product [Miscanthus lutarioriparius]|uniref:Uncharacterized protein n=1 Tax=Miscanthus lutarioriparius TaxID=422564 RepID=A0A811SAF7_9POAL|nr:unnamed protein product [Miscanthus lutarioriparius]
MALATATARSQAVSSTAPLRGAAGASLLAALALLSRREILRRCVPTACPLGATLAATETFPTLAAACCASSSSAWTLLDARARTLLEVHIRIPAPPAPKRSAELDGLCCPDVLKLKSSALDDEEEDADGEEHESVSLLAPAPPARNAGDDGQSDSEGAGVAAVATVVVPTAYGNSQFIAATVTALRAGGSRSRRNGSWRCACASVHACHAIVHGMVACLYIHVVIIFYSASSWRLADDKHSC